MVNKNLQMDGLLSRVFTTKKLIAQPKKILRTNENCFVFYFELKVTAFYKNQKFFISSFYFRRSHEGSHQHSNSKYGTDFRGRYGESSQSS